jgi:hypothetical protein
MDKASEAPRSPSVSRFPTPMRENQIEKKDLDPLFYIKIF